MKNRIQNLIIQIETNFQKELQRFTGNIKPFEPIVSLIDDILKAVHQFQCKIDLTKLKASSVSTGIKQYFTSLAYKKNKFYIMDVIKELIDNNIVLKEDDAYKDISHLLERY